MHDMHFFHELETAFRDVDHVNKLRARLASCVQRTSVSAYIDEFRGYVLELGPSAPDRGTLLF